MHVTLSSPPSLIGIYIRAALSKKPSDATNTYPKLTISLDKVQAKQQNIAKYRSLFDLPNCSTLPHLYPHKLAFRLHLFLLASKHFPYPMLGLVLVRNESTQHRELGNEEKFDITCSLERTLNVERGKEFNILTQIYVSGIIVWESITTLLYQCDTVSTQITKRQSEPRLSIPILESSWDINENSGRRYAKVTGDINPIHLHSFFARRFGFKRAVAQGMWSSARALAHLRSELPKTPYSVSTEFHLPIYLRERVLFQYSLNDNKIDYQIKNKNGLIVLMSGSISF